MTAACSGEIAELNTRACKVGQSRNRRRPGDGSAFRYVGFVSRFLDATKVLFRPPTQHNGAIREWRVRIREQRRLISHRMRLRQVTFAHW
jgi:hypothetical protein